MLPRIHFQWHLLLYSFREDTPLKTNASPKNPRLEADMSFWNDPFFGGRVLVSRRVTTITKIDVSKNKGTPKSSISILIGFSFINHPFWGTPIFGNTQILPEGRWSSAQTLPDKTLVRYHCWMQRQRRERHLLMPSTLVEKKRLGEGW